MSDAVKLPPMPEPYRKSGQQMSYDGYDKAHCHLFSIEQLRAYAIQAVMQERERCAKICREHCEDAFEVSFKDYEDTHHDGYQDAANDIESAIRAQTEIS